MKNKKIILSIVVSIFMCNLIFTSCVEPDEIEKITFLEKKVYTSEDSLIDQYPRTKGDAHSGNYFSRTDGGAYQYGIGILYPLNDTNLNRDLRVTINLWVRSNQINPDCIYAIALQDEATMVLWNEIKLGKYITEPNKWINISDSITIPGNLINKPGLIIKTFSFNTHNNTILDGDDLEIKFATIRKELAE